MSFAAYNPTLKLKLLWIELMTCDYRLKTIFAAVALTERFAALVPFRWHQANQPPTQNVNSALLSLTSACHFGGNDAIYATNAVTTASTATF